ncbi:hypothetical protein VTN96DRAFT_3085 [Rasamsonia emersonii]
MRTDIAPDNHSRMAEFRLEGTPEGGEQGWRVSGAAESEVSYTEEQNNETRQKKREEPNGPVITTYIKVLRSYLQPETLRAYNLPWERDERDPNYPIIKTWISEDFQEELFAHTRRLREGRLPQASNVESQDKKPDKHSPQSSRDPFPSLWRVPRPRRKSF